MLLSGAEVSSEETMEADVCIIGGGLAGLTVAAKLAEDGRSVLLLESGAVDEDPSKADLSSGESVGRRYGQLTEGRYRRLGGCSHLWNIDLGEGEAGPRLQPLRPIDLEERCWLPGSGWPFGPEVMNRYYRDAYRLLRLGEFSEEVEPWSEAQRPLLGFDPSGLDREYSEQPNRTDQPRVETTLFRFIPHTIFTDELPRELIAAPNVRLVVDATVTGLVPSPGGADVAFATAKVGNGHEFRVAARTFILAAGAVENARLLLASRTGRPAGLGNELGLVGRYFMEHPHFCAGWILPRDRRLLQRLGFYRLHRTRGQPVMAKLRLSAAVQREEGLLGYCVGLRPIWRAVPSDGVRTLVALRKPGGRRGPRSLASGLVETLRDFRGVTRFGRERLAERIGRPLRPNVVKLNAMTEQAPNPESRVTLSQERDSLGQPRARLDWRLGALDLDSIDRATEILGEEFRRSGLGRLLINPHAHDEIAGGWHHMGTTRMHADPRRGVVDQNCRVHGSGNLYVAGPSVFPTSGYANPALTIVALALRLADHLREEPVALRLPVQAKG